MWMSRPSARVCSFQDGQVQSALDEFRPHCELTVRNLVNRPQTVYSDRFLVTRVSTDIPR
jgi:hypothetical protein